MDNIIAPDCIQSQSHFNASLCDNGGVAAGLVLSLTSDTPTDRFLLNPQLMRAKRLRRSVLNASNLLSEQLKAQPIRHKSAMLTLTYRDGAEWQPYQITNLLKSIREYLKRKGLGFHYVWVLENTKRNRPHYHILFWLPKGASLPKPDKRGWWSQGNTKIEWIRKSGAAYLAKYISKESQGEFPKGARLHGCGGLEVRNRRIRSFWNLPKYVRTNYQDDPQLNVHPAKGGGFVAKETGEWMDSIWRIVFSPLSVIRKESSEFYPV